MKDKTLQELYAIESAVLLEISRRKQSKTTVDIDWSNLQRVELESTKAARATKEAMLAFDRKLKYQIMMDLNVKDLGL